jgi:hypothetical protein
MKLSPFLADSFKYKISKGVFNMKKSSKFLIALIAVLFSGLCISTASPAKACDTSELMEESTDMTDPDVDPDVEVEPMGDLPRPTFKY